MALDVTVGGASANSYATVAELDSYAATRIPAVTWHSTATNTQKENALIAAARILDASFSWTGSAVNSTQALTWPRKGMFSRNGFAIAESVNPNDLKNAQCELALQLGAADLVSDDDAAKKNVKRVKAGSVEVEFQATNSNDFSEADTIIAKLGREFDYTRMPNQVRLLLVPSWYTEESLVDNELVFAAL